MSDHPLELSSLIIDERRTDLPTNRITQNLSELADGVALVESFSHVLAIDTGDGLVVFDTSGHRTGGEVVAALRGWSDKPVHSVVYTHGHLDHVGGSPAFGADADAAGAPRPEVIGHERVAARFDRYRLTDGYNYTINQRQFGGRPKVLDRGASGPGPRFLSDDVLDVTTDYRDDLTLEIGGLHLEFHHALGETDDHTWTYIPERSLLSAGDQFIWNFPNCGNPQKVQRYPSEWAQSLREMSATGAELFVPAHGLPIEGRDRIVEVLDTVADTLEQLVVEVVDAMNTGATLDSIIHSVGVNKDVLTLPYLRPLYDEPEFVVRNIWRLYGGWWDGNPASLKPAPESELGAEIAALAGGVAGLRERALALADASEFRLASHLIEFAVAADPEGAETHAARADIYARRRAQESSLMTKGIFGSARAESQFIATGDDRRPPMRMSLGGE